MNLFRRQKQTQQTQHTLSPVKTVSIQAPPSPRQKVEEALQELNKQEAIYDVTFNGIRYQRNAANPNSPIAINEQ